MLTRILPQAKAASRFHRLLPKASLVLFRPLSNVPLPSENITRIERIMSLSDKLQKSNNNPTISPQRLRRARPGKPAVLDADSPPLPTTRRMADSFVEMELKFSESEALREQYVGGNLSVRMGRLMEDFDTLAGASAYRHVLPDGKTTSDAASYGFYLVTAAVDRMDMLRALADSSGHVPDLRISGHVSYATESSLEVFMRLSTIPAAGGVSETILLGRFAMACRAITGGKQKIAKLEVVGEEEEALWSMGKEMREGKKERAKTSLEKTPPTQAEAKIMHDLFVGRGAIFERNAATPSNVVWMSDTKINSALMMHPQERNVHNKIFGGHLMRLAYEIAYSTACLFARTPVTFLALDELRFALPVELGSLLILDSRVTFSPVVGEHRSFHVSVEAGTTDLRTGEKRVTNTFHFTFESDQTLPRYVLPRSYKQCMAWLDAQRRRALGIEVRRTYNS